MYISNKPIVYNTQYFIINHRYNGLHIKLSITPTYYLYRNDETRVYDYT